MKITTTAAALIILSGCAQHAPGTPGAGWGKTYTPIVDMQGVDTAKYERDMDDCRRYAGIVDADKEALQGMIIGAVLGAAVGASFGLRGRNLDTTSTYGAGSGLATASNKATGKQERILINCMSGRGYRALDGVVTTNYGAQQPAPVAQPVTMQPATFGIPAAGTPTTHLVTVAELPIPSAKSGATEWPRAQETARAAACHQAPVVTLAAKGPGFETYSVPCANGDVLMVRCEYGNCRPMK